MKNLKNSIQTIFLLCAFTVLGSTEVSAQITFPDDVDDAPAAPIDGLVGLGIAAGAYFGIRKKVLKKN